MSTSLADQLRKLALPESIIDVDRRKKVSLLFDPSEAAHLDRDAFYEIGVDGLKDLIVLEPAFEQFHDTLFDLSSRYISRTVESQDINKKINKNIQKFLRLLSPYLLLKQSHKALEWLIYRYQIHSFNVDDLMALILPYHETKIFVKILQLFDLNANNAIQWKWLQKIKEEGVHLPKSVLVNHGLSNSSFLRFICDLTLKGISENKKYNCAKKLGTLITFYTSSIANTLSRNELTNHHITVILPSVIKAFTSDLVDFKAAGYIIAGQLVTYQQISKELLDNFIQLLLDEEQVLEHERMLLILLIFQTQQPTPNFPPKYISKLTAFSKDLLALKGEGIQVGPVVLKIIEACLESIVQFEDNVVEAQVLCFTVATEVLCDLEHCKSIIWLIDSYYNILQEKLKSRDSEDEDSGVLKWMKELMNTTVEKYSDILDNDKTDEKCQKLREKWKASNELPIKESELLDLLKKCEGESKESAWLQLRPLLLKKINEVIIFEALCKVAPFYDNLVLLLCLNKFLHSKHSESEKLKILNQICKSRFGGNNPHIQEINSLISKNRTQKMAQTIESYFLKQQKESENPIEFEPWLASLQEMKQLKHISESSEVWSLGLKILVASLPDKFNATYALQLMSALSTLKKKNVKIRFDILKFLISYLKSNKREIKWYDLSSRDSEIWLKIRILEYVLDGMHNDADFRNQYNDILDEFSKKCFCNQQEFVRFLGSVCCGSLPSAEQNPEYQISSLLQIHALHVSWSQLKTNEAAVFNSFKPELGLVVCCILMTLHNSSGAVRLSCLHFLEAFSALLKNHKAQAQALLLDRLLNRFEEISLDPNQVSVALYCCLSPSEPVQATLSHSTASAFSNARAMILKTVTAEDTPSYVSHGVLQLLDTVNSPEIIEELSMLTKRALEKSNECEVSRMIVAKFWSRINETVSEVLEKEQIWDLVAKSIGFRKCDSFSPAISFLKCVTREVFDKLSRKRKFQLLEYMIETRSETESSPIASAVTSVMKKICIDCEIILPIINQMINLLSTSQKRRETPRYEQPIIIESKEWKKGISLLELIQSKKRLVNSGVLIQPLFTVLKFCLDQDEQTAFEYTKQLVLSCLLDCCKSISPENENGLMNVELVVQCLRASPNPQTHHHALMLLSHLSSILPKQVMHNVMAIFTFMGTSVARMDDEHSVKVVTQVVESVVPVLVTAINAEHRDLQIVIAEILRVFVWAVKDIPQHRRKPLFLQLLNTLQPENCLWIFILLLLENHIMQGDAGKLDTSNMPMNYCLGLQLCLSSPPNVVLEALMKVMDYLINLPVERMSKEVHEQKPEHGVIAKQSDGLFDIEMHTPKQLRHFSYMILTFLSNLLADNSFIIQVAEQTSTEKKQIEDTLKDLMAAVMRYTPIVKTQLDKHQTKFWKAMTHQCYEILDKFILLVPNDILLSIIRKLLGHSMKALRRKALDLLNNLLQQDQQAFTRGEKKCLMEMLEPIAEIINSIGRETEQQDLLLQQTALITLKLLAKLLCVEHVDTFKNILIQICDISKSKTLDGPLLGTLMLAIAELVTSLRAHSVSELPVFMPLMLKIFSKNANPKKFNELGLNSITLAIHRVVDVMPNFLSPYLDNILFSVCKVSVKAGDKTDLLKKLVQIRQKIAANVEHRILIPAITRTYKLLIENEEYEATEPLFSTLSASFSAIADVSKIVPDVSQLFIAALSFRSDCVVECKDVSLEDIGRVEQNVIDALVPFVLKLSESLFKPLYYQILHWASEHPDRFITFFSLSHALAESLKGLFVLFAGNFLQKAAFLLDAVNLSKNEKDYFADSENGERKSIILLENILKTLHSVFLYDSAESSNFLNKDKFEVLLHPLVDQLENTLGGIKELENRTSTLLTSCLAQMALATEDTLWKSLNYEILQKTKSVLPQVRIGALETIVAITVKLGDDYLMLLPETIGSLAELLEDDDERVENAMKNAIQRMEDVLGQPIREYFQ